MWFGCDRCRTFKVPRLICRPVRPVPMTKTSPAMVSRVIGSSRAVGVTISRVVSSARLKARRPYASDTSVPRRVSATLSEVKGITLMRLPSLSASCALPPALRISVPGITGSDRPPRASHDFPPFSDSLAVSRPRTLPRMAEEAGSGAASRRRPLTTMVKMVCANARDTFMGSPPGGKERAARRVHARGMVRMSAHPMKKSFLYLPHASAHFAGLGWQSGTRGLGDSGPTVKFVGGTRTTATMNSGLYCG